MTLTFSKASQCDGKRAYKRRGHARKALRQFETSGRGDRPVNLYLCPHCGWYHIGGRLGT